MPSGIFDWDGTDLILFTTDVCLVGDHLLQVKLSLTSSELR